MNADSATSRLERFTEWVRGHRFALAVFSHIALFALCWFMAFGLAYNFKQFGYWFRPFFLLGLPFILLIKLSVFFKMGLHRGSWRYVSMRDAARVTYASWWSFFWIFLLYFVTVNLDGIAAALGFPNVEFDPFGRRNFPDSVLLLDFVGTVVLVSAARVAVRLHYEQIQPIQEGNAPKLLIIGAGNAGENVVREILRQPVLEYRVVGFLDDDPNKLGGQIHTKEVLGPTDKIKTICDEYAVDEILIAMPSASRTQVRRVIELCQGANLRFKTLPAMADIIAGRARVQEIRDVNINDLLGRPPVRLDDDLIAGYIRDRVVMVTGAGGSIGSEMCRQIAPFSPKRLVLLEQAEQNLFEIERELRGEFPRLHVVAYIADITDFARIDSVFARERPTAVYHAAAHKHVPMMEHNPGEALKNNVRGTQTVANAAARHDCEKFVMISTDKAVNPTSVMGCSKRVAEMYIQALNERTKTHYVTVRFGNVLGSSGSVVPIFKDQIVKGGPVTVTHPDMVRYFMTIPEASQLVLQAGSMGTGGEIFVLDMGEPVKIVDLARDLITLSGFRPGEDIEIVFSGVRPGEKLYEELSITGENISRTSHPKIGIWKRIGSDWEELTTAIDRLLADADELEDDDARLRLKDIVPEYAYESNAVAAAS